jgi:hypothetical protein
MSLLEIKWPYEYSSNLWSLMLGIVGKTASEGKELMMDEGHCSPFQQLIKKKTCILMCTPLFYRIVVYFVLLKNVHLMAPDHFHCCIFPGRERIWFFSCSPRRVHADHHIVLTMGQDLLATHYWWLLLMLICCLFPMWVKLWSIQCLCESFLVTLTSELMQCLVIIGLLLGGS